MSKSIVTVVIPTIKVRKGMLRRALASVIAQTHQPTAYEVSIDRNHDGSAITRNRALAKVKTGWVAFLDDDDYLLPRHIQTLLNAAGINNADVVYPGCKVIDVNHDEIPLRPEWGRFGSPFDPERLKNESYIPVTSLVRTEVAQAAMFGPPEWEQNSLYDDWGFYTRCLAAGAKFLHVPEITWVWHHHGRNTSGQGDRW